MNATQITTHVQDGLNRLMEQYKGRTNITNLLTALIQPYQDLENAIYPLASGQTVYGSVGAQLDGIGTVVGISRNGLDDAQYLLFILGKIAENNSDSTIQSVKDVASLLMNGTDLITVQGLYPAALGLSIGGTMPDPSLWTIIYDMIQNTMGTGIRLDFISVYQTTGAFAFDGGPTTDAGFGDPSNQSVGGPFGAQILPTVQFGFSSSDPTDLGAGFGDPTDPMIGGAF